MPWTGRRSKDRQKVCGKVRFSVCPRTARTHPPGGCGRSGFLKCKPAAQRGKPSSPFPKKRWRKTRTWACRPVLNGVYGDKENRSVRVFRPFLLQERVRITAPHFVGNDPPEMILFHLNPILRPMRVWTDFSEALDTGVGIASERVRGDPVTWGQIVFFISFTGM